MGRNHPAIVHPVAWEHAAAVRGVLPQTVRGWLHSPIDLDIAGHEVHELDWTKEGLPEEARTLGTVRIYPQRARCRRCGTRRFVFSVTRRIIPAYGGACRCQPWVTREKKAIPWDMLEDQHLLHTAAMLERIVTRKKANWKFRVARLRLTHAIAELRYRDLLPTQDELRVAVDRCCDFDLYERDGKPIELMGAWAKFGLEMTRKRRPWAFEGQDDRHPSSQLLTA